MFFGTFFLKVFGVSLSMIRIAGGVILAQIGRKLFSSPQSVGHAPETQTSTGASDVAFVPMAMPIMFGPGAMATLISVASEVEASRHEELAGLAEVSATMAATFHILAFAKRLQKRFGPRGIDAAPRIAVFSIAAMGVGWGSREIVRSLVTRAPIPRGPAGRAPRPVL
jgi:multiple antibiotic resistance protein